MVNMKIVWMYYIVYVPHKHIYVYTKIDVYLNNRM